MVIIEKVKNINRKRKITFKQITEEWLEMKKEKVKISTYSNYVYTLNNGFMGKLENCTLRDLEKYNYKKLIAEYDKISANRTLKCNITKLKSILYFANNKYGSKINLRKISGPSSIKDKIEILSDNERKKLESYCRKQDDLKCAGVFLVLHTGLRIGEICALKWNNVDLDKREIRVRQTAERVYDKEIGKTKVVLIEPKSKTSIRDIPISNKLYAVLKKFKKYSNTEKFFLTGKDKLMEPRLYSNYYKLILEQSKIKKKYRFHDLRHTFATNCVDAGMDAKSLSEILGHSNIKITLERYVHSSYRIKKKYLERL